MPTPPHRFWRIPVLSIILLCLWPLHHAGAAGEPAADFLKRLRAAKYFDVAINYLDRLDEYPGVDADLKSAVALEKAQTFIDAAVASRNVAKRDEYLALAEEALSEFLKQGSHPRFSEARLQLGNLQMVRAAQLMAGQVDDAKRESARQSYLAAAKTFDVIVNDLRGKLKGMQGAKIDPQKEPEKLVLRDQYRGDFLRGKINAAESRKLAARTYDDPGKEGKELLQKALEEFTDLSDNYDTYVQGAMAMLYRGQVQDELGMTEQALDSYIRMLEQPDADPLRDSKYQATSGMIRIWLSQSPPNVQSAIQRGQGIIEGVRLNEKRSPSVLQLQVDLAKAYLEKAKDTENQKPAEVKRAQSSGRQLLIAASKVPGEHAEVAKGLLADMGIGEDEAVQLPTAEAPDDLDDALAKAGQLLEASENISESLKLYESQKDSTPETEKQKVELTKQLAEVRANAIYILRRGLAMVDSNVNHDTLNQARQFLCYLLYEQQDYRDAVVVGTFLAKNAPGDKMGLQGGVVALTSLQQLLNEVPDEENESLFEVLADLGEYMATTWPDDPSAAGAKGVMITIALNKERWNDARTMIAEMPEGPAQASFRRLMGQLQWNESIKARKAGDDGKVKQAIDEAQTWLQQGLDGIKTDIVEPEAMKAALVLVKVYLKQGEIKKAVDTLDHPRYGPTVLISKQGPPDEKFSSDLYSTELQAVVQLMTTQDDPQASLDRATEVMEKLRQSVSGEGAQQKLTGIYLKMATDIREQLESADAAKKAKLIEAFRVFLDQIAGTTEDQATLTWVAQTLLELGDAAMQPGQIKAAGQAANLLDTAIKTFEELKKKNNPLPLTVDYQLGRAYRLQGQYKKAIDTLEKVLKEKPMMLDAQLEAALAYEQWAAIVPPQFAGKAYASALNGARPNPAAKGRDKDTIWGWGRVSQLTSGNPQYREVFFDARYHVALCRYLWGKAVKDPKLKEKAISDINMVHGLHPDLGGPQQRTKFDQLLKTIQKDLGKKVSGLPPPKAAN